MLNQKKILTTILALVLAISLMGCSNSADSGSDSEDPLVLGIIQSLTGSAAAYGESHNKGTSIAIDSAKN